jgi:protein-S-isoprenylcysteine O-methyltransferase Ste14
MLNLKAFGGLVFMLVVLGAALFGFAGTFDYWQAWVLLVVFGVASGAITIDLARRDPALLARRVVAGPIAEVHPLQKIIQACASLVFLGFFIVSALDHRHGWSTVPAAVVIAGDALVAIGFLIVFLVYRANTFTSATIEVAHDQRVVSTGPYAIVRHPMYAGALLLLVGLPIARGSWWALLAFPFMKIVIVVRLLDEERHLAAELPGYPEYRTKVRYRLAPHIW